MRTIHVQEPAKQPTAQRGIPALVIVNCLAGTDDRSGAPAEIEAAFHSLHYPLKVVAITPELDLRATIAEELDRGCTTVIAAGGDGTINAVAEHVLDCTATFGVIPLGTLNHFARDLGIPVDIEGAARTIVEGHTVTVDAGEVNGKLFLNNSSIGLYPQIVTDREAQRNEGRGKWTAMARAILSALFQYGRLRVHLMIEGQQVIRSTPLAFVGNNRYEVHGLKIGRRKHIQGGELCIYLPHSISALGFVWLSVRALLGRLRDSDKFDEYVAQEFYLDTRSASRPRWLHFRKKRLESVAVDGEVLLLEKPLRYRSRPQILRVIVPKEPGTKPDA